MGSGLGSGWLQINPELLDSTVWIALNRPGERFRIFWSTKTPTYVSAQILGGPDDGKYTTLYLSEIRRELVLIKGGKP